MITRTVYFYASIACYETITSFHIGKIDGHPVEVGWGCQLSIEDCRKSTTHKSGEISADRTHKSGEISENRTHKSGEISENRTHKSGNSEKAQQ